MKSPRGLPATTLPEGAFGDYNHTEREIELSCCKAAFLLPDVRSDSFANGRRRDLNLNAVADAIRVHTGPFGHPESLSPEITNASVRASASPIGGIYSWTGVLRQASLGAA